MGPGAGAGPALRGGLRGPAAALLRRAGGGRGAAVRAEPHGLLGALPGLPRRARHAARHPRAAVGLLRAHHHVQARGAAGRHGDAPQQPRVVLRRGGRRRLLRGAGRARGRRGGRGRRGRAAAARAVRQPRAGGVGGAPRRLRAPALPRARAHAAARRPVGGPRQTCQFTDLVHLSADFIDGNNTTLGIQIPLRLRHRIT